jgi:hypothetical protein
MFPYFKKLKKHHQKIFILLIATSAVLFWRGVWGVADELLFPNNYMLSSLTSLGIAIIVFLAAHYSFRNLF